MAEKMNAIEDAWSVVEGCDGVILLDADLVFTAPLLKTIRAVDGEVILTPNYYPKGKEHLVERDGELNGGFVFTRSRAFHHWWRDAYAAVFPRKNEQLILNEVRDHFRIGLLGEHANVGFWRTAGTLPYVSIPADCLFLHVHLYQPLFTMRQWVDKSYALHCLGFLMTSGSREHQLFDKIMAGDRHGWFDASLRVCGVEPRSTITS